MRGRSLGRLWVVSVLFFAALSCKQGVSTGVESGSELMTAEGTPLSQDPTYGEWGYAQQSETAVDELYAGLNLAGKTEDYDIIEGDIVVEDKPGLNLASAEPRLWPNATVVYMFDPSFGDRADIERAMRVWTAEAGIQFRERTNEGAYAYITGQKQGCFSNVGYSGGEQYINYGTGCTAFGTKLHELGHTIGLNHEQSRRDRDQFITLRMENVKTEQQNNFRVGTQDVGSYDFRSVMHYGKYSFTNNGQPTIEAKNGEVFGQRQGLSEADVTGVQQLYGVAGQAPGTSGGVLAAGQTITDSTVSGGGGGVPPAAPNVPAAPSIPAPTTSVASGCAGFGGYDWEEAYVKNTDGTCRDAKTYCTCWRTSANTCGLYLPDGKTNVAGANFVAGESNCKESCKNVVPNGATHMQNTCNQQLVLINSVGRLEIWKYSNNGRDATSDVENL